MHDAMRLDDGGGDFYAADCDGDGGGGDGGGDDGDDGDNGGGRPAVDPIEPFDPIEPMRGRSSSNQYARAGLLPTSPLGQSLEEATYIGGHARFDAEPLFLHRHRHGLQ